MIKGDFVQNILKVVFIIGLDQELNVQILD
jgi:hypothetical protein